MPRADLVGFGKCRAAGVDDERAAVGERAAPRQVGELGHAARDGRKPRAARQSQPRPCGEQRANRSALLGAVLVLAGRRVLPVDGLGIARAQGLGRIVNSALLGALACTLKAPTLEVLERTVVAMSPRLHDENIAAVRSGWQAAHALLQEAGR